MRAGYEATLADMARDAQEPMHPAALAKAIADALPADALAVFDGGHTSFWSNDFTPVREPRTCFPEPGMSHLGFGLPYAMALKLQQPARPVVNITGDGSFGFTPNKLDTARRSRRSGATSACYRIYSFLRRWDGRFWPIWLEVSVSRAERDPGSLSARHLFVLGHIHARIESLLAECEQLLEGRGGDRGEGRPMAWAVLAKGEAFKLPT